MAHYSAAWETRKAMLVCIEETFEALFRFVEAIDEEERRAIREGLNEESLAVFDLLKKPDLEAKDIRRIKKIAVELLETLKREKLHIDHWRDKESTRDAVLVEIRDFLYREETGLPVPSLPSPVYGAPVY